MTPSLKISARFVNDRYKKVFDGMYEKRISSPSVRFSGRLVRQTGGSQADTVSRAARRSRTFVKDALGSWTTISPRRRSRCGGGGALGARRLGAGLRAGSRRRGVRFGRRHCAGPVILGEELDILCWMSPGRALLLVSRARESGLFCSRSLCADACDPAVLRDLSKNRSSSRAPGYDACRRVKCRAVCWSTSRTGCPRHRQTRSVR